MRKNNLGLFKKKQLGSKAFTLIEIVIVAAILSVVSLAISSTVISGVKIAKRIKTFLPEEDVNIFFDKFSHDLRNCLRYKNIVFKGTKERMEFASIAVSANLQNNSIAKIVYWYEQQGNEILKSKSDVSQVFLSEEGKSERLLGNLKSAVFNYYVYDKENNAYLWREDTLYEGIPYAVRITIGLDEENEHKEFTKTVFIPIAF